MPLDKFKKILILVGFLAIFLPTIAFAASNITVTNDGPIVTIKIDNIPEGTDLNKDIVVTGPNGRVSMSYTNTNGILSGTGTDAPGSPGEYTYTRTEKGSTPVSRPVTTTATGTTAVTSPLLPNPPSGEPADRGLEEIKTLIANIGNLMLSIAGGVAIIYIIIGAYHYFFAFGSEEQATTAKKTITYAIAGLVLIILSKVILTEVWNLFATDADAIKFLF